MANIKISDLTAAAAASGTQEFEVNDSLTSKKVTGAQILSYVQSNTTPASIGALANATDAVSATNLASNSVTTAKIADNNVTLAKLPDIATASILGRTTAGTGDPEVLTGAQARSVIGADNASNLTSGTVSTARLGSGTANSTTFLRGDNTWATVSGGITLSDAANLGVGGSVTISYLTSTASVSIGGDISGVYLFRSTSGNSTFQVTNDNSLPGTDVRNRTTSFSYTGNHTPIGFGTWRLLGPMNHNGTLWQDIGYGNMATTRLSRGLLFIRVA